MSSYKNHFWIPAAIKTRNIQQARAQAKEVTILVGLTSALFILGGVLLYIAEQLMEL